MWDRKRSISVSKVNSTLISNPLSLNLKFTKINLFTQKFFLFLKEFMKSHILKMQDLKKIFRILDYTADGYYKVKLCNTNF
jgi:hypothetical protein